MVGDDEIESFLNDYQDALGAFDAARTASLWGTPGTMHASVGSLSSREETAQGLEQSYPRASTCPAPGLDLPSCVLRRLGELAGCYRKECQP